MVSKGLASHVRSFKHQTHVPSFPWMPHWTPHRHPTPSLPHTEPPSSPPLHQQLPSPSIDMPKFKTGVLPSPLYPTANQSFSPIYWTPIFLLLFIPPALPASLLACEASPAPPSSSILSELQPVNSPNL